MTDKKDVCGVIVTYNPDDKCLYAIEQNYKTLEKIIVYDNSTNSEYHSRLSQLISNLNSQIDNSDKRILLIGNNQNVGLSKAYNACATIADGLGFNFILLFDQDSFFDDNGLELLLEDYDCLSSMQKVGAIGPSFIHEGHRFYDFLFDGEFKWKGFLYLDFAMEVRDLINSGMLISLNAFFSISGYDEKIVLDNADRNFTLRLRTNGYHLFQSRRSKLVHNYGEKVPAGILLHILYRNPSRDYFIKDLIRCLPIAKKVSFVDKCLIALLILSKIFGALFLKDKKKERMYHIMRGIKEGLLN